MILERTDIVTYEDNKYITMDTLVYEGDNYFFMNKLNSSGEPTKEYCIFIPNGSNNIKLLVDEDIASKIVPIFQENLKKIMEDLMNEA